MISGYKPALLLACFLSVTIQVKTQNMIHSAGTAQAHSHNDYLQKFPFWQAYYAGFGSIEADVFLQDTMLLVAHTVEETASGRTLEDLYLKPLQDVVRKNDGWVYADTSQTLQLLVDLKTAAAPALAVLLKKMERYPDLTSCPTLKFVITGNRPAIENYSQYPTWLLFDGDLDAFYNATALSRIALFSDNFAKYTNWDGKEDFPKMKGPQ